MFLVIIPMSEDVGLFLQLQLQPTDSWSLTYHFEQLTFQTVGSLTGIRQNSQTHFYQSFYLLIIQIQKLCTAAFLHQKQTTLNRNKWSRWR